MIKNDFKIMFTVFEIGKRIKSFKYLIQIQEICNEQDFRIVLLIPK